MKHNRKMLTVFTCLILSLTLLLPCLVSCGEQAAESATLTEEEKKTEKKTEAPAAPSVPQVPEETPVDPDYIPPENYINYDDCDSLNSSPNVGYTGSMVVSGGNPSMSQSTIRDTLAQNPNLAGTAAQRRESAEAAMRAMLTVRWTPASDTTYSYNAAAYTDGATVSEENFAKNQITLEAGKVYQGLPYTLGSGALESFLLGAQSDGDVYTVPLTSRILSGSSVISARLGVDDVDALAWAWAGVSTTAKFVSTDTMIAANGVLPVGGYEMGDVADSTLAEKTLSVIGLNGTKKMLEAYAAMQMADGLVSDTASYRHAMMAVSVNVVRNPDGSIDPVRSYVTVLEQTDAGLVSYEILSPDQKAAQKGETLVIGGIDVKYSFQELLDGGFLPVTCAELCMDGPLDQVYVGDSYRAAASFTKATVYAGTVYSNRRFVSLTQTVKDAGGNAVINTTVLPTEADVGADLFSYKMSNWVASSEASRCFGDPSMSVLVSGQKYSLTLTAVLATGETKTLRSYSFTY